MSSALERLRKARQGSTQSLASTNIGSGTPGTSASSSGSALARLRAARLAQTQPTLTPAAQRYAANNTSSTVLKNGPSGTPVPTEEDSKNRGGPLGGIGYVGEKVGLGFLQGVEGVVDYVGAGIAELFGNDEASERIISNDWMNYSHADEWFNPGEGWRVAGDVAGGIGTSLPGLAAGAAVTLATGGAGAGAAVGLAISGFSAAGTSTKEAYLESGELGLKEFGYGAIMGGVEAGVEALSGKIGAGLLKGIDEVAGAFGKTASKTAKALTAKSFAWDMTKEFASEAFEEGFSEWISPYAKKVTYDPNAKNATLEEISYAALVGGLSGLAMGGGRVGVSQLARNVEGNAAVKEGRVSSIMDTAKAFSDYEGEHPTKLSSLEAIRDLYTRLDAQGVRTATELTGNQRRALGELQALTTTAVFEPAMQKSALSAIAGADAIAEKLNADGNVKIVDGKMQVVTSDILAELQKKGAEVRDITAEDIRGGVDVNSGKSIREALKGKDVLRYVVASDVAGRFLMTAKEVETAARAGTKIKSQADLNTYIEHATPEMKSALGAELGIADNEWATLKLNRFNEAAAAYRESGRLDAKRAEMQAQKEKASANEAMRMSMDTVGETTAKPTNEKVAALKEKLDAKKIDSYAAENIEGYSSLGEANKSMIRQIVREGRATGISDEDTLRYARVAAKTGVNVTFDKQAAYKGKNEAGEDVYHAAVYDPENNRIIVNPETQKKHTVLLMHELSHAMRMYVKGGNIKYAFDEDAKVSKKMWDAIEKYYADENGKLDAELALDEASAYYAEALFGTDTAIDLLLGKKQTLKEKILSFFAKSAEYYSSDAALSKEARRQFRKYKKMFDSFAERNQYRNAEARVEGAGDASRRASFSSIAFSFYGVDNMTTEEFESKDYKETEGYKAYVDECLNNMRQTQKGFDEKAARAEIERSIDGIVSVAVAMKKAGYDIADTAEKRSAKDTQNRLLFSSLEPNSDYFTSSDISTICDKRQNFAEIYDDIVRAEEAKGVPVGKRFFDNVDNYFYIHKVLADKGLTQPCRQCYVESMRKNLAPMANAFLTLVRETDGGNKSNPQLYNQSGKNKGALKSNNAATREEVRKILDGYGVSAEDLTVKMLTTADGLAEIKITMPELYERFNAFYGQSKPKMPKGATPFRFGELTALLTDNKGNIKTGLVKKINSTGGFRLQSYSDFQIKNYADVLQVLFEAGTLGLNGHAYTKVPAFLDATADTNLKRNISIFMYNDNGQWKIDRNDSFPYTLDEIYDVVKADKSGNTGVIAVVQNEDMAAYVMANENIGYFIPFHKSGIKMGVVRDTIVKEGGREIKGYKDIKDHTRQQTEVWATTTAEHKANTKVSKPINIYEEGLWDFDNSENLPTKKLIEKNVKAYIDACEKSGYLPKFREYVMNNGKVLRDVLKYSKELGFVSDSATVNDISFEYKGYRIPYGYYKCLGDFSMITPSGKASGIEPISLANYKFDKAVKFFSDAETVRRNEILQQFSNGTEREYYRESTMTAEELQKVIDTKRTEVVNEIVDKSAKRAAMAGEHADNSISQSAEKTTDSAKKVSENSRRASMDVADELEAARGSIVMDLSSYKPKGRKETIEYGKAVGDDAYTRFQIQATNQQAGLEKELKRLGVKNGEALVQSARSASNAAATMIGDMQMRIGDGSYEVQGEGLEKIYHPILNGEAIESELKGLSKKEREARLEEYSSDFFAYLFHMHSADRMSLEQRSTDENNERIKTLDKKVKRRTEVEAEIKAKGDAIAEIASSRTKENNAKRKELRAEWSKLRAEKKALDRDIKTLTKEVAEFVPMENKPVLGHAVDEDGKTVLTTAEDKAIPYTAEESKAIADEILRLHPEFKEAAEKVWAYNKNLNQYRVDAGLISQESFDRMQELYPHYVPTYREGSRTGIAAMSGKYALKVKATVKSAKGGLRPLCRPDVIMARQTEETIKAGRVNQLARTYYDAAETETNKDVNAIRVISRVDAKADETIDFDPTTIAPKNNRVTFYKNGEKIEMEVDKNVFDGFDAFNSQTDMGGILTGTLGKVMDLYKRLITSYSPIFTIRNAIRDLQDAGINTKYGKTFLRNYKRAIKEISSNGKYWRMYRAAGGLSSSLFDFDKGFGGSTNSWGLTKAEGNSLQKLGTTIENANVFIEQLPRLAEFISSMEAKNSIEQAILDAADVTTNFGRSGKMAKWLNRNFIPFLNPSIQGFSKLVRNVTDRKTAKELVAFLIKAALLGFVPQIINQLLLGDDDEYEKLRDSDKENNYIFRWGDQFIKIPKGRVAAAMAGIVNRGVNTAKGKEDAWEGYLDSVLQNITPVDSASRDIFSPFRDVKANKTWYGTDIEGRSFDGVPVEERTDEGTSWIAEVLAQLPTAKAAELSPKKIHYLIDQYTGIIGDIVLPATSKKAQKDMLSGAFVIDPVVSNDLSNRFYKQYDKAVETKNSTKSTEEELEIASFRYKYLGKIKDTVSDMQKLKREIQASDLKATEKLKQTREIQAAINLLYEEALADIDKFTELYNGTYYLGAADIYSNYVASGITDEQYASLRYAETIRSYYGAETALSQYNSAVYDKAVLFNKAGLDYDTYYEYYFSTRGIESDVDRKGEVVAGSKKKKTLAAIRALGVSQNERLLLTAAAGYALSDGEKRRLLSHIMRLEVSKEEKAAIAEACGFKVKNGRISMK